MQPIALSVLAVVVVLLAVAEVRDIIKRRG